MEHKAIPASIRQRVWLKYNKHCAYCGCELTYQEMQVDHKESVYWAFLHNQGSDDSIDNLMPSCRQCNFYKSTFTLEGFRNQLKNTLSQTAIKGFQQRLAIKYGMIEVHEWDGKFYFEKN